MPEGTSGRDVQSRRIAQHEGRAHRLALDPVNPHCFFSCGEDGVVNHFDLRLPHARCRRRVLVCVGDLGQVRRGLPQVVA